MLRTALKLLLALVLCLNGFLAPVAMAAHSSDAVAAEAAMPCHGDGAAKAESATAPALQADTDTDPHPACCQPGHCLCAALFSIAVPDLGLATTAPRNIGIAGLAGTQFASLRSPVALRPPIR